MTERNEVQHLDDQPTEQTFTEPEDELFDLVKHYVKDKFLDTDVPAPALCGVVDTWYRNQGSGTDGPWVPGIICPWCQDIHLGLK